jgi:hypothetical protein
MATGGAQVEVERRLREIGARLDALPGSNKEVLSLVEVSATAPGEFESVACFRCRCGHCSRQS